LKQTTRRLGQDVFVKKLETTMMLQFLPVQNEVHNFSYSGDLFFGSILHERPATISMPMIKIPRSVRRKYSDSELAAAAIMMEKLRAGADASASVSVEDRVLDAVVEKLMGKV
jgi:hypothetical protein